MCFEVICESQNSMNVESGIFNQMDSRFFVQFKKKVYVTNGVKKVMITVLDVTQSIRFD